MRPIYFQRNYLLAPPGSCLACFGDTKVICTASIEREVPPFLNNTGKGWLTAEYAMLPGSTTGGRKKREIYKRDGRSTEIQRLIGRSLRAAVNLDLLGEVTLYLDCDVIQADGGTRTASISGAWVALYDALSKLASERGEADPERYLAGQVAAVSVGKVNGEIICDLDYARDKGAEVDMNVVMREADFIEIQGTGEEGVFNRRELDKLLDSAEKGIKLIYQKQLEALGQ